MKYAPSSYSARALLPGLFSLIILSTFAGMMPLAASAQQAPQQTIVSFPVGRCPRSMAFDGANLWVANLCDNTVSKLRASDGTLLGTFPTAGVYPLGLAFDGANIWIRHAGSDTVTKLRASDGVLLGTFSTGYLYGDGVVFDGENIWAVAGNGVTKFRPSDGAILGRFTTGLGAERIVFDGANIWVTNQTDDTVTKLRASDGLLLGNFSMPDGVFGITFDGTNIWVANTRRTVTKFVAPYCPTQIRRTSSSTGAAPG